MWNSRRPSREAFTLVELLVVIAIIAVLVSMLLPALNRSRAFAQLTQCKALLHGIGVGLYTYSTDYNAFTPVELPNASTDYNGSCMAGSQIRCKRYVDPLDWNKVFPQGSCGTGYAAAEIAYFAPDPFPGPTQVEMPVGLGQLLVGACLNPTGGTPAAQIQFAKAGYLNSIDSLFCPSIRVAQINAPATYTVATPPIVGQTYASPPPNFVQSAWACRNHWCDGEDANWGASSGSNCNPNNPGGPGLGYQDGLTSWCDSSSPTTNVGGDFKIGYSYRAVDYSFMYDATHVAYQYDMHNQYATSSYANCRVDAPKYSSKSVVVEKDGGHYGSASLPNHLLCGGGNILWGDDSCTLWTDTGYMKGQYDNDTWGGSGAAQLYMFTHLMTVDDQSNDQGTKVVEGPAPYNTAGMLSASNFKHSWLFAEADYLNGR